MKKVARLRVPQDEFVPPNKASVESNIGVRTTGRIKKPKAVFDPSDNYVPRAQRLTQTSVQQQVTSPKIPTSTSPSSAGNREKQRERSLSTGSATNYNSPQDSDICSVCQKREPRRGGNYRNKLLTCANCSQKVHKWCASTDFYESAPIRQGYKCDNCRTCDVCETHEQNSKRNGELITCAKCLTTYHATCHTPKVTKHQQTQRNWKCTKCAPNASSAVANNSNTGKDESMPVTVIRQIIGYDANMQQLPKTPTHSPAALQQLPKTDLAVKEDQQEKQDHSLSKAQERKSTVEPTVKTLPSSHSHSEISSTSSESDASDDEDYMYVEKKKRKLLPVSNNTNKNAIGKSNGNNHGNGNCNDAELHVQNNATTDTEHEQKEAEKPPIHVFDDLPKRDVVRTWSVEKLSNYVQKFFPNEAQVFKEHEIDGNALLLLKRSDVIKKLPLKLGPSLRLYNFILKIQTQKPNDPTLGWDCSVDTLLPSTE